MTHSMTNDDVLCHMKETEGSNKQINFLKKIYENL